MIDTKEHQNALIGKTFIDLFSGIGGFRIAFDSFGAKCVFSSEWDTHSQEVYHRNFGEKPRGDITKIDASEIPSHDILCAGFPCQAFSISGKQKGFEDTRGTLFFDVARIVQHHRPDFLMLENVKNFERHDKGRTLNTVKLVLKELDYDIYHKVLNASLFGIPQSRKRIFILGFNKRLGVSDYKFPRYQGENITLDKFLLSNGEISNELFIRRDDIHINKDLKVEPDMFGHYPQKPIRIGTINNGGQGERIYHPKGHAITLTAYGGGVASKTGAYLINDKVRKLHPRECARLMGFPDSFKIYSKNQTAWKQFGDSVVVDIVQILIKDIVEKELI